MACRSDYSDIETANQRLDIVTRAYKSICMHAILQGRAFVFTGFVSIGGSLVPRSICSKQV
jgi:hypothetical protein